MKKEECHVSGDQQKPNRSTLVSVLTVLCLLSIAACIVTWLIGVYTQKTGPWPCGYVFIGAWLLAAITGALKLLMEKSAASSKSQGGKEVD